LEAGSKTNFGRSPWSVFPSGTFKKSVLKFW
jgi:hypothetical protein